jgi:hypothetical protein
MSKERTGQKRQKHEKKREAEKKINGRKREIAKRGNKKHKQSEERIKNMDVVTRFSNCSLLQKRVTYWFVDQFMV